MSELRHNRTDTPDDDPPHPPPPPPPPPPPRPPPPPPPAPPPDPPAEPATDELPEGSWEGRGRYLTPDQNALADRELAARRDAEPLITTAMRRVEADLDGADLAG